MSEAEAPDRDEVQIRHQQTQVQGRYLVWRGPEASNRPPLLVATHGYGEDAGSILREVRKIPSVDGWLVVSVDAPHPFYTKKGDVVRCWMTKIDREQAIAHNTAYVTDVVEAVRQSENTSDILVFAGFSQGVAMAWRGLAGCLRRGMEAHGLLALAADVPPDIAADPPPGIPPVLLGRGTRDEWYSAKKMEQDLHVLEELEVDVTPCVFEDGHLWATEYLAAADVFLRRVSDQA
ncbi:MAG: hypothetical protein MPN21_17555 [Thermoanaerobaculia bacterium]|nr:hypothetical protein [Thermoanaerobaculia bacterium]